MREQIEKFLRQLATKHYQINDYAWGDMPDLLNRENIKYPYMTVSPIPYSIDEQVTVHRYSIAISDRVTKDLSNQIHVDSDTNLILSDILAQIKYDDNYDYDIELPQQTVPFMYAHNGEVTGHVAEVGFSVDYALDKCAVPSDPIVVPEPESDCPDANVSINAEFFKAYASGAAININILNSNSDPVGTSDPSNNKVDIADSTVKNNATTPTYTLSVAAETTEVLPQTTYNIYVNTVLDQSFSVDTLKDEVINITP